jgi:two-component system sensor histidine kinase BaeS
VVNGVSVGAVIASPVERLTRNTDINFDRQQKRTSWLIVALPPCLPRWPPSAGARPAGAGETAGGRDPPLAAGDFTTRVTVTSSDELGRLAQDFNQLASTLERNQQMRRDLMADSHELRTPLAVLRGELEAIQDGVRFYPDSVTSLQAEVATLTKLVDDLHQLSMSDEGAGLPENLRGYHYAAGSRGGRFPRALCQPGLTIAVSLPETRWYLATAIA